jgi:hypothetical protein
MDDPVAYRCELLQPVEGAVFGRRDEPQDLLQGGFVVVALERLFQISCGAPVSDDGVALAYSLHQASRQPLLAGEHRIFDGGAPGVDHEHGVL